MLSIENFSELDQQKIKSIPKSFKVTFLFFLFLCVPASFLFGLLGLTKKGNGYWPTTLILLTVFAAVATFVILKDYLLYHKDRTRQKKYVGTITVIGKSTKKNEKTIFTDLPEIKKLELTSELFNKVSIGDKLTIEISMFSKTIFKFENEIQKR